MCQVGTSQFGQQLCFALSASRVALYASTSTRRYNRAPVSPGSVRAGCGRSWRDSDAHRLTDATETPRSRDTSAVGMRSSGMRRSPYCRFARWSTHICNPNICPVCTSALAQTCAPVDNAGHAHRNTTSTPGQHEQEAPDGERRSRTQPEGARRPDRRVPTPDRLLRRPSLPPGTQGDLCAPLGRSLRLQLRGHLGDARPIWPGDSTK